jgi:type VI secretion system IcmF/VasK family protein
MTDVQTSAAPAIAVEDEASRRDGLLNAIKRARDMQGRGAASARPWYLLIGPPGAGKTSALLNSGLQFPLASETAGPSQAGAAPTRAYDYWFAEDAVLIDSAGRYTIQASGGDADKTGWRSFLNLLKRYRPQRPLSGVIAMLPLDELAHSAPEERLNQARTIRKRLREIDEAFGLRVPAYIVFTKADRLAGFTAFFDDLTPAVREQAWGATLPLPEGGIEKADLADRLAQGLDRLRERLDASLLARLQNEADPLRRNQIFAFPRQFALLTTSLREMLGELAASSRLDPPPRLRGVYFTSARQQGSYADLLAQDVSAQFDVDLPPLDSGRTGGGSFFLTRLFQDVVLREENLVSVDARDKPGRRSLRRLAGAVAAAIVIAIAAFWVSAYFHQQRLIADTQARLDAYAAAAKDIPTRDVADADFVKTVQILDRARETTASLADRWPGALAFDQSDKLLTGQNDLYGRALNLALLPRILVGLQEAMQLQRRTPEETNDAKLYLMLGGKAPLDRNFALAAATSLFARLIPGPDRQVLRQSLKEHAAALLSKPLAPIDLDPTFAEDAQFKASGAASP